MPSFAAHSAVALVAAPHQIRSRKPSRMRLEAQQAGRVGKHRPRVGLGKTLAAQHLEQHLGVLPRHVGVALALGRRVAEIAPAVDHLLGRAAADAELQAPAGDEVGRAGVLGHVERVLVAHVDDGGADLDAPGPRADRRQQRKRRAELAREMMHPEIGAVRAELLRRDGEVDRLQQRVGRRARLRLRRRRPVAERQEADLLGHGRRVWHGRRGLCNDAFDEGLGIRWRREILTGTQLARLRRTWRIGQRRRSAQDPRTAFLQRYDRRACA